MFIAFDVLHARGDATLRLPYRQRRADVPARPATRPAPVLYE